MIVLVPIDEHGDEGAPIQFDQPYIHVGHGEHNNLILDEEDRGTSYEHALISIVQGRAVVLCEPTAKATYIDGVDISFAPEDERQLKPGDILSFGKGRSIFRVEAIEEASGPEGESRQIRVPTHATKGSAGAGQRPPVPRGRGTSGAARPVSFQVFNGDQMVREEVFRQPIIRIGRMKSSHLLLVDKSVSRTHAVIEVTGENEVLLMDLDSSGGTAVNGTKVKKALLKSGDELSFGEVRVVVHYGQSVPAVPDRWDGRGAARPSADPDDIQIDVELAPNATRILSDGDWEALDGPRVIVRRSGGQQDEVVLAKSQTTLGRLPSNDIQLDDAAVSSNHALLVAEAGVFLIVDQKSTNGTYLNGERCTRGVLKDGDVIQIGRYELVFVAQGSGPGQRRGTEILSPEVARALFAKPGGSRGGGT